MSLTNTHDPALERGRLCVVIAVSLLTSRRARTGAQAPRLILSIIVCSMGLQSLGVMHCWRDFSASELQSDSPNLPPTRGWSITRARSIIPLGPEAFGDDLALATVDAAGVGSRGSAVRIYRAAFSAGLVC